MLKLLKLNTCLDKNDIISHIMYQMKIWPVPLWIEHATI